MVKREKAAGPEQGDAKVSPEAANKYVEGEGKSTETQAAEPAGHTSGHGHTGGPKELSKGVMGMFGKKKGMHGGHGQISVRVVLHDWLIHYLGRGSNMLPNPNLPKPT